MRKCQLSLSIAAAMLAATALSAFAIQPQPGAGESLGGQLIDDLGPGDVTPGIQPPSKLPKVQPPGVEVPPNLRFRPPSRFDDLGEDLGAADGPLPLIRARQGMEQAEALLSDPGSIARARDAQQHVISQLDELIDQLCKQCQGGGGKPGEKQQQPQAAQRSQPKPGGNSSKAGNSATAASDSTDPLKGTPPGTVNLAEREELAKRAWGHLPERDREQMIQSFSPEFLPKYELELEKYYRRLAEEKEQR